MDALGVPLLLSSDERQPENTDRTEHPDRLKARPDWLILAWMLDRITINPNVCGGKPTIRGLRITVDFILKLIGDAYTADEIVEKYPELEKDDVYQAARYAAWLASETTIVVA